MYSVCAILYIVVAIVALADRTPKVFLPTSSYITPQGVRVTIDNDRVAPSQTCFRVTLVNKFSPYLVTTSEPVCTSTINPGEQLDIPVPLTAAAVDSVCTYSQHPWSNCTPRVDNLFPAPSAAPSSN